MNIIKRIFIGVVSLSLISVMVLGFSFIMFTIFAGDAHIILRVIFGILTVILVWMLGESSIKIGVTNGEEDGGERNRGSDED